MSAATAQAAEAVTVALAASYDRVLRALTLARVVPLRGGAALQLVIRATGADDLSAVRAKLDRAKGYLRSEVAAAIYRKRAPELSFVVLPGDELIDDELMDDEVMGDDDSTDPFEEDGWP